MRFDRRRARRAALRALIPLAWMGSIYFFSAQPNLGTDLGVIDLIGRKIAHMVSFGGLAWLWFWALRGWAPRPMLAGAAIAFVYAVSDEWHQSFVEGRHGTVVDVGIDSVGIAVAAWVARRQKPAG
jgi:VanZ family protein